MSQKIVECGMGHNLVPLHKVKSFEENRATLPQDGQYHIILRIFLYHFNPTHITSYDKKTLVEEF